MLNTIRECTIELPAVYDFMRTRKVSMNPPKDPPPKQEPPPRQSGSAFQWDGIIEHLPVKETTKRLILDGAPKGERSDAMMTVINACVWSGLTPEQIVGVFLAYPIGQKFRDDKHGRVEWLQPQIDRARAKTTDRATASGAHDYKGADPAPDEKPPLYGESSPNENKTQNRFAWIGDIEIKKPVWLIPGLFEQGSYGQLFGDPGSYKSFLAFDWGCRVASGTPFAGKPVIQSSVVILAGEGVHGLPRRVKAWCIHNKIDMKTLPLAISRMGASLTNADDVKSLIMDLKELLGNQQIGMIIIDTVARNFGPGDENSTKDMGIFNASCDRLRNEFNTTVLAVHHTGQADKTRGRGSMALPGAIDSNYRVELDQDGICHLYCEKMKEFEKPGHMAFKPLSIDLGYKDDNGDPITSLVLEQTDAEEHERKGCIGKGAKQQIMMQVLNDMVSEKDFNLEKIGLPPTGCVLESDWIEECRKKLTRKNIHDNRKLFFVKAGYVYLKGYS